MATDWDEPVGDEQDEDEEDEDPGFLGGGGPAATLPEYDSPEDEDRHRADTDHGEL